MNNFKEVTVSRIEKPDIVVRIVEDTGQFGEPVFVGFAVGVRGAIVSGHSEEEVTSKMPQVVDVMNQIRETL